MFKNLLLNLKILIKISHWIRNEKTSPRTDKVLLELLELDQEPVSRGKYTAIFKRKDGSPIEIWMSNYPYAFGSLKNSSEYLPTRKTAYLFYNRFG